MNAIKNLLGKLAGGAPSGPPASLVLAIAGLAGGAYVVSNGIVTIEPGHVGLIYNRLGGLNDKSTMGEGFHLVVPWFQRAIIYDTRTRPSIIHSASGSKDLQMVQISLRVLFKPSPTNLPHIYGQLGTDFDERVLPSIVNEVTKAVVAQYNASELLTKREEVSLKIRQMLARRAGDFKILLDDVAITNLQFSKEYTAAVEAKQVAQQDAERAKYIVERAIQEKRSIIIKAEGEAKSAELIGQVILNNPAFLQLRRIQNSKEIAEIISTSNNKVYLGSETLLVNQLGEATALTFNDKNAASVASTKSTAASFSSSSATTAAGDKKGLLW